MLPLAYLPFNIRLCIHLVEVVTAAPQNEGPEVEGKFPLIRSVLFLYELKFSMFIILTIYHK